ncbi:hypothetical protein B6S12_09900 [Helicobacter valdiviensis]|uniref:Uncharacterized protein n=1 Tax=Helicobacter valdiviensis TaxID=1458358 RepID=A0A2W6PKU4_9HELI|nr:hypothetical protein [Helicobacter valdiviensis]PZT47283.1 hypothetical protein B6S12_09900 [Helicobacter valdiviensis]
MGQVSLKYIYDIHELRCEIEEHCKEAESIRLYSNNFIDWGYADRLIAFYFDEDCKIKEFVFEEWLKGHLCTLISPQTKIQIYDYCHFDEKDINKPKTFYLDKKWNRVELAQNATQENNKEYIQVFLKQSNTSKILYDFVEYLNPEAKSITKAIDEILDKEDKGEEFLKKCIIEKLKNPLMEQISSIKESQIFEEKDLKESIEKSFKNLLEDISKINKEGNSQIYREILILFLNLVNIFDIKKVISKANIFISGAELLFEGGKTFLKLLEWYNNKYNYAIYKNLIKLLIDDIAPMILLVDNRIFHHTLIIDDRICIEFSGIDTRHFASKANVKQELAICFKADTKIFSEEKSLDDLKYGTLDNMQKDSIMVFGKNHIEEVLKEQMSMDNNRLAFIESPFFNSIKLAKIIKDNNELQEKNNESYNAQNYLLITNTPRKYNAGLNQKLIENILGNEIYYPDTIKNEVNNEILSQAPKDYETTINYSRYKIAINQKAEENKAAFVLSLSPFVRIDYAEYEEFRETKEQYKELQNDTKDENMQKYLDFKSNISNVEKILNYYYIQQQFIQPDNKQMILEKEKQYFKEGISCIQEYINSLITTDETFGNSHIRKFHYNIFEVFLLALTFYVLRNFYISVSIKDKSWWEITSYETFKIENQEELKVLPMNVWLSLEENKSMRLCFSKKRKQELLKSSIQFFTNEEQKSIFCIEEFVELMEEDINKGGVDIFKEYLGDELEQFNIIDTKEEIPKPLNKTELEKDIDILNKNDKQDLAELKNLQEIESKLEEELKNQKSIKEEIEKLFEDLGRQPPKYDYEKTLEVIGETFIDEFFPLIGALGDSAKLGVLLVKAMKEYCDKGIQEALYTLAGYMYLPYVAWKYDIKVSQTYSTKERLKIRKKKLAKKALCSLIMERQNKRGWQVLIMAHPSLEGLKTLEGTKLERFKIKSQFLIKALMETNKDVLKALPQAIIVNLIDQLWVTHYEKTKTEYERLLFLKFSYKYNQPYAIERTPSQEDKGSITYPMLIYNTFISSNFVNLIVGSRLHTGGLGEKEALFFLQREMVQENVRTYLVNKLFAYLCLDELRSTNGDLTKKIGDLEFFTTDIYKKTPPESRLLKLICKEDLKNHNDEAKKALYQEYKDKESEGLEAIDAYHKCMDYLEDVRKGIFNTKATDNRQDPLKHRNFLKNLDIIGQNNIKALYVGVGDNLNTAEEEKKIKKDKQTKKEVKQSKDEKEKRPKFVGRLATTIIIKNGLHIG